MSLSLRKIFTVLGTATVCLLPPPAHSQSDLALQRLQDELRREIAARCLPQFDGDKSKGELTNADLPGLLDAKGLYSHWPNEGLLDGHVRDAFTGLLQQRYVFCVDKRLKGLTNTQSEPISAVFFLGTAKDTPGPYRLIRVIAISPTAPTATHPSAASQVVMADAAQHIRFLHRDLPKQPGVNEDMVYHHPIGITSPLPDYREIESWRPVLNDANIRRALPTPTARPLP
jgi:hypothetical protein